MLSEFASWEWHLTPCGWILGMEAPAGGARVRHALPADRVATYVFSSIGAPDMARFGWTQIWTGSDSALINRLMRQHGSLPASVAAQVQARRAGDVRLDPAAASFVRFTRTSHAPR